MIVVEMMAGLANRMFQYAFYLSLKAKGYHTLIDDTYKAGKWKFEDISIEQVFPNIHFERADSSLIGRLGGGDDYVSKVRRKIHWLRNRHYVVCSVDQGYCTEFLMHDRDLYLSGNWISELYFKDIEQEIRRNFIFHPFSGTQNIEIANEMQACNSVAIHVRKGADYNKSVNSGVCDTSYYKTCIDHIKKNTSDPKFYVFSDNYEWVKENLSFIEYTLIHWNPTSGFGNHLDMQLMTNAKHNIIGNSTYSWWGAWLNPNPDKIVLAPLTWFNKDVISKSSVELSFTPENWIVL